MTPHRLQSILMALGARNVSLGNNRVTCSCLLAPWTHSGGRDSRPSMVVFAEGRHGDPIYSCQGCHRQGALRDLVCFLWYKTRRNLMFAIEALDGTEGVSLDQLKGEPFDEALPVKNPILREKANRAARLIQDGGAHEIYRRKRQENDAPWHDKYAVAASDKVPEIPWSEYEGHLTDEPHPYAAQRGVSVETWQTWELGVDPKMRRVLFPMRDHRGRLVAISGRLYEEEVCLRCRGKMITTQAEGKKRTLCGQCGKAPPPKYLHSKGFKRNVFLYGEHLLPHDSGVKLYVVEGHLDTLLMWQAGYRPVVATLGTKVGESQVERIVHYASVPGRPLRVVLVVHDGDDAGREMGTRLKSMVAGRVPVFSRPAPDGSDPAQMSPLELMSLLGPPVREPVDTPLFMP